MCVDFYTDRECDTDLSPIASILNNHEVYRHQFLSRLQSDCDYYLGNGDHNEKHLWAKAVNEQIEFMKAVWNSFSDDKKPEWISYEDILNYEKRMNQNQ